MISNLLNTTPLVVFWGVFWPGILVAILALWAALYRPQPGARATPGANRPGAASSS